MIKFNFAKNDKGEIIRIGSVNEGNRKDNFFCISCEKRLGVRLGKIRRKHFFHLGKIECNEETYLHKLGKEIFYQNYLNHLKHQKPLFLSYSVKKICNCFKLKDLSCELGVFSKEFNLTERFTQILIEKKEGSFIPDLKLIDNQGNVIFIEIAVTHKCDQEKIDSGFRIIEFDVQEENDALSLERSLIVQSPNTMLYNFKIKNDEKDFCKGDCKEESFFFFVSKKGRANIVSKPKTFKIRNSFGHIYILELGEEDQRVLEYGSGITYNRLFRKNIAEACDKQIKVKNCYLCRYHAENNDFISDLPIYCKFLKHHCASNYASDCEYFRPDRKIYEEYIDKDDYD